MAMEQKLVLKQTQRLVMTVMLQQAIKLLPLTKLELIQTINREFVENPFLDEATDGEEGSATSPEEETTAEKRAEQEIEPEFNWTTMLQDYPDRDYQGWAFEEVKSRETILTKEASLADHLLWQLTLSYRDELEKEIGAFIIWNLDDDGYLQCDLQEVASYFKVDLEFVEKTLKMVQGFDPVGVGARDLQECLLVQARHLGMSGTIVEDLILNYLNKLEEKNYHKIAKELGVPLGLVLSSVRFIKELDPKPGSRYSAAQIQYITPDISVVKTGGEYQIVLNDEGIPRLRINPLYQRLLKDKRSSQIATRQFLENKYRSALWLIKSIEQRQQTLFRVANSIVKFQRDFLDYGISQLRPLVLRDVANDIGMHESTVSRVTTNKYMNTPQGLFEMKYFFHSGIDSLGGRSLSSIAVKAMIKKIVDGESSNKPLTDQQIMKMLCDKGLKIARRTITKYRKELRLQPSSRRRKLY